MRAGLQLALVSVSMFVVWATLRLSCGGRVDEQVSHLLCNLKRLHLSYGIDILTPRDPRLKLARAATLDVRFRRSIIHPVSFKTINIDQ